MLSLCRKSGNLKSGAETVENLIKNGEAKLVIIPEDAGENTKKKYSDKCSFYGVDIIIKGTVEDINRSTGNFNKTTFAIVDEGLAKAVKKAFYDETDIKG